MAPSTRASDPGIPGPAAQIQVRGARLHNLRDVDVDRRRELTMEMGMGGMIEFLDFCF